MFKHLDKSILRTVALYMSPRILLPGDVVVYQGQLRTAMIYIISGVLQVSEINWMIDDKTGQVHFMLFFYETTQNSIRKKVHYFR